MKILCLDAGNTHHKWAIVENNHVQNLGKGFIDYDEFEKIMQENQLEVFAVSSVSQLPHWIAVARSHYKVVVIDENSKLPFLNAYSSADTLGYDRIALLAGAYTLKDEDASLLAISMGTCITYNFLPQNKVFRGGAISPGMHMRAQAMHEFTEKLPLVNPQYHLSPMGFDTQSSLQNGIVYGIAFEIEGMIKQLSDLHGKINVFLTGGDASFFESIVKSKIFVDSNLIFKGIYAIAKLNL